jgi:NACalpha-BTF3-like transcription factor
MPWYTTADARRDAERQAAERKRTMATQQVNLYSPRINDIMRWADSARVARVMQATGCTAQDATEYLVAEEGDEADAILSYRTDRMEVAE